MPKNTLTQLSVPVVDTPGALGSLTEVLAKEKVNVVALTSETVGEVAVVHLVVESPNPAVTALKKAGHQVVVSSVLWAELPNRPGALAELAKALGTKGVNITRVWGSSDDCSTGRVVLSVDKPEVAESVLSRWTTKVTA